MRRFELFERLERFERLIFGRFEYKGVVDLVAVKRNNRSSDELTIMLVQVKGGSARVTKEELSRLRMAARHLRVTWNVAQKPGKSVRFERRLG